MFIYSDKKWWLDSINSTVGRSRPMVILKELNHSPIKTLDPFLSFEIIMIQIITFSADHHVYINFKTWLNKI